MKLALAGCLALLLAAEAEAGLSDKLPLEAYVDPIDRQIAATGAGLPGRPFPCAREEITNGIKIIVSQDTERCVKMLPRQSWRGLWRAQFEGSRFCPEPARTCDHETPGEDIWLNGGPGRPSGGLYRVVFEGRRTMYNGPYGHLGMSDHEVYVDKAVRFELIEDHKK